MAWKSNDSDPIAARRRQLAEQERLLAEQRQRITDELHGSGGSVKPEDPPVWRMEEEEGAAPARATEPTSARKRNLARQRQRDRFLFFIFIVVFLIVVGILLWVAYVHNTAPSNGT
jgi:hypothetical protein